MSDSHGTSDERPDFADWMEAWLAGYCARKEGLDGATTRDLMPRMVRDFQGSGTQQARRLVRAGQAAAAAPGQNHPPEVDR